MGERADCGKMAAMCGRSTPLAGNADETSSVLYISMLNNPFTAEHCFFPRGVCHTNTPRGVSHWNTLWRDACCCLHWHHVNSSCGVCRVVQYVCLCTDNNNNKFNSNKLYSYSTFQNCLFCIAFYFLSNRPQVIQPSTCQTLKSIFQERTDAYFWNIV